MCVVSFCFIKLNSKTASYKCFAFAYTLCVLNGKTIILGMCGGVAAYKSCELASRLTQMGARVQVVMTEGATHFVAPQTFAALTLQPVHTSLWSHNLESAEGVAATMAHISLAREADVVLIAPATANIIAKFAHGFADDLLTTICLATRAPILVAPAMNPQMWSHQLTQRNLRVLEEIGYQIIQPESGRMACEDVGAGRLPSAETLIENIHRVLDVDNIAQDFVEKKVLITAGPTREPLDPVRFLSNRSSGKMGYALAEEAARRGAKVTLVSGPTNLAAPPNVQRIDVTTTQEMFDVATKKSAESDIIIACAAPADYRATNVASQKIKKTSSTRLSLELEATPDIIAELARRKKTGQLVIGFAAETENLLDNARHKLQSKNLDAIVANDVSGHDTGFDSDFNRATWISRDEEIEYSTMDKSALAKQLCRQIAKFVTKKSPAD